MILEKKDDIKIEDNIEIKDLDMYFFKETLFISGYDSAILGYTDDFRIIYSYDEIARIYLTKNSRLEISEAISMLDKELKDIIESAEKGKPLLCYSKSFR